MLGKNMEELEVCLKLAKRSMLYPAAWTFLFMKPFQNWCIGRSEGWWCAAGKAPLGAGDIHCGITEAGTRPTSTSQEHQEIVYTR